MTESKPLKQISVYLDPEEVFTLEELVVQFKRAGLPSPLSDEKKTPTRNDLIRYGIQKIINELQCQVRKSAS